MKRLSRILPAGFLALSLVSFAPVAAESETFNGHSAFNGKTIASDFDAKDVADRVTNLQPGDDVTFNVTYKNEYKETTAWYMSNNIIQTLEKTKEAKKVSGTGSPEKGAYTYELVHYDKDGNKDVLFSNAEVGGDNKTAIDGKEKEGLEGATNALDEWFFIDTLEQGESGSVTLHVEFEGETEVNDYMDTNGGLAVRFAVELVDINGNRKKGKRSVNTYDSGNNLMWYALMMGSSAFFFVLAFLSWQDERKSRMAGGKQS